MVSPLIGLSCSRKFREASLVGVLQIFREEWWLVEWLSQELLVGEAVTLGVSAMEYRGSGSGSRVVE